MPFPFPHANAIPYSHEEEKKKRHALSQCLLDWLLASQKSQRLLEKRNNKLRIDSFSYHAEWWAFTKLQIFRWTDGRTREFFHSSHSSFPSFLFSFSQEMGQGFGEKEKVILLLSPQYTRQPSQHITHANALRPYTRLGLSVPLFQALCRRAQHAVCHALGRLAVLFDFVDAVCEDVDVGFERVGERGQVRL